MYERVGERWEKKKKKRYVIWKVGVNRTKRTREKNDRNIVRGREETEKLGLKRILNSWHIDILFIISKLILFTVYMYM